MSTTEQSPAPAPRVSRNVEPSAVADLVEHPPRATLAFVDGDDVEALPASARWQGGVHLAGVRAADAPDVDGREVVLVRDDGPYWFELRAITVRGLARRAAPPDGGSGAHLAWYSIEPRRVVAWDYGALRAV